MRTPGRVRLPLLRLFSIALHWQLHTTKLGSLHRRASAYTDGNANESSEIAARQW